MSLTLHRSPRVDLLAEALASRLSEPLDDPFASELVIVPAHGVERWLSQQLSHHLGTAEGDGVAANIEFRAPRSLVAEVVGGDADDPWRPDSLVWPLLEVIDESLGEPWCVALTRHLGRSGIHGDELRHGRRWAVAHRLARLFSTYAGQRPTMLADWESGGDGDGLGGRLDPDLVWEAELWRRLVAHVGSASPGRRHRDAVARLRASADAVDLPVRVSLFGHTRLSVTEIEVLDALAAHRDVDVWLPHPSAELWEAMSDTAEAGPVPRADDHSHTVTGHPLLATLGRDLRELQRAFSGTSATSPALAQQVDRPATVLGLLQSDVEANQAPPAPRPLDRSDRSLQVHACHGPARQVEVLRETVLGLLADDPTLEPRDVVVMCPDIETYAPLIEAAFGLGGLATETDGWHPGQRLEVRLADRSLVQTNPLLDVLQRVLSLAGGRVTASEVLDLAATAPVRRRFGFTDDDLDTVMRWVDLTGVRWAFDAPHREPFGLAGTVQNTWSLGLDRMLAGVAVSDEARRYFGPTLPLDDIGSSDIDLVGRLAELVDRLRDVTDRLDGAHPVEHWITTLRDGLGSLTAVAWGDEWQTHQTERELAAIGTAEQADALELRIGDVRALVESRLGGRPTRSNFRTGSLTVCTMVPMRSVPHRVVCLLGLDDGVFPRAGTVDGDDVLARQPLTGERDPRSEDRQLLLDAVMAATEHLVVTYSGAHEVTGRPRPPSVPLGELLDAVDLTVEGGHEHVVIRHPLQAFDARNFRPGVLVGGAAPFSFDSAAREAAVVARGRRDGRPEDLGRLVLPPPPVRDVELADLAEFLRRPVRTFLRRRLGLDVFDDDSEIADRIPIDVGGLDGWKVGDRMLADRREGAPRDAALQREWRRGSLPPGRLGWTEAQRIADKVDPLADRAAELTAGAPRSSVDVDLEIGPGRRLRGTVVDVHDSRVVKVGYSGFGAGNHLDAWLALLALNAGRPGTEWTAGSIGPFGRGSRLVVFESVESETARSLLADLVALRDLGLSQPLRLPFRTGFALATEGEDGRFGAVKQWTGDRFDGERDKDGHPRVWGPRSSFGLLRQAESGLTVDALALRLWRPVLERRAVVS